MPWVSDLCFCRRRERDGRGHAICARLIRIFDGETRGIGAGRSVGSRSRASKLRSRSMPRLAEDLVRRQVLNRPGGNLTGTTSLMCAIGGKQLGLLHELVPKGAMIA